MRGGGPCFGAGCCALCHISTSRAAAARSAITPLSRTLASTAAVAVASASVPPPRTAPLLSRETAQLDRIRTAVRGGDTLRALRALDAYDEQFRDGILRPEAEVLRIEVAVGSGALLQARALAHAFIARYPTSPHVSRIRELVHQ